MLKEGEEVEMNCTFIANPEVTEIDWFQNVSKAALRHAFSACVYCVFKVITLVVSNQVVVSNQGNYFENATACSKRTLKTTVATQLKNQVANLL